MSTFTTRTGNPHHMISKDHKSASYAKKALRKPVDEFREWAVMFNHALRDECDAVVVALSDINLNAIPTGQTRRWELTDEPTGVTLVVEVEKTT